MIRVFFRKLKTANRIGLLQAFRVGLDRIFLIILARIYNFHPWPASAPISARPYKHIIARLVNDLKPVTVVVVGCGLGGILSLINAAERYGFDIDEGVILVSRFIRDKKITFVHGDLSVVSLEHIDVLVLVNWIHEISPQLLEELLTPLLPRTLYPLLDAIDPDGPSGYKYKHDFAFLSSLAQRRLITRPPDEGRSFHLFEVST
jgi:SAM-dependent methyltransferase